MFLPSGSASSECIIYQRSFTMQRRKHFQIMHSVMSPPSFMHALTLYEPCISPAFSVDSKIKAAKPSFLKVENIQSTCNYLLAVANSLYYTLAFLLLGHVQLSNQPNGSPLSEETSQSWTMANWLQATENPMSNNAQWALLTGIINLTCQHVLSCQL